MGGDLDRPQRGLSGLRKFCCFGPATIEPASADNGKILCAPGLFVKRCKCLFGAQKNLPEGRSMLCGQRQANLSPVRLTMQMLLAMDCLDHRSDMPMQSLRMTL